MPFLLDGGKDQKTGGVVYKKPDAPAADPKDPYTWTYTAPATSFTADTSSLGIAPPATTPEIPDTTRLDELREERLMAAIDSIAKTYATKIGAQEAQRTALEGEYNRSIAELGQRREDTTRAVNTDANVRGLLKSGIRNKTMERAYAPIATAEADLEARLNPYTGEGDDAYGSEVAAILSMIELLRQEQTSAKAAAELETEQSEADLLYELALIEAGL